jgi:hypothetical protein
MTREEAGMTREGAGVTGSGSGMTGLGVGWERYRIRFRDDTDRALGWERPSGRDCLGGGIATSGSLLLEFIKPHDEKSRPEGRSHLNSSRPSPYCLSSRPPPFRVIPAAAAALSRHPGRSAALSCHPGRSVAESRDLQVGCFDEVKQAPLVGDPGSEAGVTWRVGLEPAAWSARTRRLHKAEFDSASRNVVYTYTAHARSIPNVSSDCRSTAR